LEWIVEVIKPTGHYFSCPPLSSLLHRSYRYASPRLWNHLLVRVSLRQPHSNLCVYSDCGLPAPCKLTSSFSVVSLLSSSIIPSLFSTRCNIYITRLCHDVSPSVRLSVTEVRWRIIAKLGFKFRSHFTAHCGGRAAAAVLLLLAARPLAVLLAGGSSRAMLASARLSCSL